MRLASAVAAAVALTIAAWSCVVSVQGASSTALDIHDAPGTTVVRLSNGTVYFIDAHAGTKALVPSTPVLRALGYQPENVPLVEAALVAPLALASPLRDNITFEHTVLVDSPVPVAGKTALQFRSYMYTGGTATVSMWLWFWDSYNETSGQHVVMQFRPAIPGVLAPGLMIGIPESPMRLLMFAHHERGRVTGHLSVAEVQPRKWIHIAVQINGNLLRWFINGQPQAKVRITAAAAAGPAVTLPAAHVLKFGANLGYPVARMMVTGLEEWHGNAKPEEPCPPFQPDIPSSERGCDSEGLHCVTIPAKDAAPVLAGFPPVCGALSEAYLWLHAQLVPPQPIHPFLLEWVDDALLQSEPGVPTLTLHLDFGDLSADDAAARIQQAVSGFVAPGPDPLAAAATQPVGGVPTAEADLTADGAVATAAAATPAAPAAPAAPATPTAAPAAPATPTAPATPAGVAPEGQALPPIRIVDAEASVVRSPMPTAADPTSDAAFKSTHGSMPPWLEALREHAQAAGFHTRMELSSDLTGSAGPLSLSEGLFLWGVRCMSAMPGVALRYSCLPPAVRERATGSAAEFSPEDAHAVGLSLYRLAALLVFDPDSRYSAPALAADHVPWHPLQWSDLAPAFAAVDADPATALHNAVSNRSYALGSNIALASRLIRGAATAGGDPPTAYSPILFLQQIPVNGSNEYHLPNRSGAYPWNDTEVTPPNCLVASGLLMQIASDAVEDLTAVHVSAASIADLESGKVQAETDTENHLADYHANAAENGDPNSQLWMGNQYYWGTGGLPRDQARAVRFFQEAANHLPEAQYNLGVMHHQGAGGLPVNHMLAGQHFDRAAEGGFEPALNGLGKLHLSGGAGFEKDAEKAFEYFERAAQVGSADGLYNAGLLLREGLGGQRNVHKAVEYFARAAFKGHQRAAFVLGSALAKPGTWLDEYWAEVALASKKNCTVSNDTVSIFVVQVVPRPLPKSKKPTDDDAAGDSQAGEPATDAAEDIAASEEDEDDESLWQSPVTRVELKLPVTLPGEAYRHLEHVQKPIPHYIVLNVMEDGFTDTVEVPLGCSCQHGISYLWSAMAKGEWAGSQRDASNQYVAGNLTQAAVFYEIAAELGFRNALANTAYIHLDAILNEQAVSTEAAPTADTPQVAQAYRAHALRRYRQAGAHGHVSALLHAGEMFEDMGNYDAAAEAYYAAALRENSPQAWFALAGLVAWRDNVKFPVNGTFQQFIEAALAASTGEFVNASLVPPSWLQCQPPLDSTAHFAASLGTMMLDIFRLPLPALTMLPLQEDTAVIAACSVVVLLLVAWLVFR